MEAATEAPAERTVEATEPALDETVLRQDDMIRSELGSSPFLPPFPRFIPPRSCSSPETNASTDPSDSDSAATTSTRGPRRPSAIAASGAGEAQYHPQCPYSSRSPPPASAIRPVSSRPSPTGAVSSPLLSSGDSNQKQTRANNSSSSLGFTLFSALLCSPLLSSPLPHAS